MKTHTSTCFLYYGWWTRPQVTRCCKVDQDDDSSVLHLQSSHGSYQLSLLNYSGRDLREPKRKLFWVFAMGFVCLHKKSRAPSKLIPETVTCKELSSHSARAGPLFSFVVVVVCGQAVEGISENAPLYNGGTRGIRRQYYGIQYPSFGISLPLFTSSSSP